jgi:hypothetical protein
MFCVGPEAALYRAGLMKRWKVLVRVPELLLHVSVQALVLVS